MLSLTGTQQASLTHDKEIALLTTYINNNAVTFVMKFYQHVNSSRMSRVGGFYSARYEPTNI